MAASSSESDENTRDLLIYVFYDVDTEGLFANYDLKSLRTSDQMFPRIDEKKNFVNMFNFSIKKPHIGPDIRLNIAEYRSWVINKDSMIYRKDKPNNVDVVYIWSNFITNHQDPVYKDFMRFLSYRPKKFVYAVKFCHNLPYFRNMDGFSTLQNMVNADSDTNDVSLFNKYRTQIILNVFVDDYFKNPRYNEGSSIDVFKHFLNDIGLADIEYIDPCFIMKQGDVSIEVISAPSVIKHTDFMFLEFQTYMSDIYSDSRVRSLTYPMKSPLINSDMYLRRLAGFEEKLADYEERVRNLNRLLNTRNTENTALRNVIDHLTTELEEKKVKIRGLKESSKLPIGISGDMMGQIDDLQLQIVDLKREIKKLEEELEVEKGQNKELQRDHNNLLREFAKSQKEVKKYKDLYDKMVNNRELEYAEEKETEQEFRAIIAEIRESRQQDAREFALKEQEHRETIKLLKQELEEERLKNKGIGIIPASEHSRIDIEESFASFEGSLGDISVIEPVETEKVSDIKEQLSNLQVVKERKMKTINDYTMGLERSRILLDSQKKAAKGISSFPGVMEYHDLIAQTQKEINDLEKKIEQERHLLRVDVIEPEEALIAELKQRDLSAASSSETTEQLREDLALLQQDEAEKEKEIAAKMAKINDIQDEITDINFMRNREPDISKVLNMEARVENLQKELVVQRNEVSKAIDTLHEEIEPLKKEVEGLLEETTIDIPAEESDSFISPEETEITFKHRDVFHMSSGDFVDLYNTMNINNNMWLEKGKRDLINENMLMEQNVRLLSHSLHVVVPSDLPELLVEMPDNLDDFKIDFDYAF